MTYALKDHLFARLRESERYRLTAIVEMARLPTSIREHLVNYASTSSWPLLQQPEFTQLQPIGPWLFAARPGATLHGQNDFYGTLGPIAGDAVCGWLISAMPPAQLVTHLSHANTVIAPDGGKYLLRYHTAHTLMTLHARRDLPGIATWLMPIHSWWIPATCSTHNEWQCVSGSDLIPDQHLPPIQLDLRCWDALAGDPLGYQLADLLEQPLAAKGIEDNGHITRLGLAQHHLAKARELGLNSQDDLIGYVTFKALQDDALSELPAWQTALKEALDQKRPFAEALQHCLRQHSL
ncbi:hypothetical protein D3C77_05930 [compost metagenome]|uniref:DUF4123 domain-containing protein n=1 Tax=Pseudomonas TaxID=286 RepID=UPI0003FE55A9|nr:MULTISPECIES: DUF4123 domain-containing protein [Pseudomonas]MCW2271677.1 hypothetical protein [Pseudomonas sp. JUb96]